MNKTFLYIIVVLVIVGGGLYWYAGQHRFTIAQGISFRLNADVYPLYSGATWSPEEAVMPPERGVDTIVRSVPVTDTMDITAASLPFTKYYEDKLTAAGWTRDMMREAGGPGAEVSTYTKGDQFIVVSFQSVFKVKHPDAPSECPCDVQLTLLSGTQ